MTVGGLGGRSYEQVVAEVLGAASVVVPESDVVYLTQGLDIVWVSESVTSVLGWQPSDLVGRPALTLVSPNQDRSWVDANRHRLLAGRDVVQRLLIRMKDGSEAWASGVAHPMPGTTGIEGFAVVLHLIGDDGPRGPAAIDEVTGVENRREILACLDESVHVPDDLCILMVEFQNLNVVNESLGHSAGDEALAALARRIRASLAPGMRVGRVSGKTFLIACVHADPPDVLQVKAREMIRMLSGEMIVGGRRIEPALTVALVQARPGSTALTLLRDADVALSHARRLDEITVFTPDMSELTMRRFVIEDELRFAVDANEFELHFQPIVSLADRTPVAAEALVRWNHPREGLLSPGSFLPIAEESRLIRPIGRHLLVKALGALANLPPHAMEIGVNVSGVEMSDPTWLDGVTYAIDRAGIDPCCLVLEVTETAVITARRDIGADLRRLRDMGVGIYLDDFGTGYSSLSLLHDLPVSGIKLDKSFVRTIDDDRGFGAALVQGVIALMRPLGLTGVAEGIETERQAERLAEFGWEFGQGYLFGFPGPFSALPPAPARPLGGQHH